MPTDARVRPGRRVRLALTWTVPEPGVWSDLTSLELRLRDAAGLLTAVRWDEATNSLRVLDARTGRFGPTFAPGAARIVRTHRARLHLADASIDPGGPSGQSVTLSLTLRLKPRRGRTVVVDAVSDNDAGRQQVVTGIGQLRVRR